MKEEILKELELAIEKLINAKCDLACAALIAKLQEIIPGKIDDVILEAAKPQMQAILKAELLKQAEKISPLV